MHLLRPTTCQRGRATNHAHRQVNGNPPPAGLCTHWRMRLAVTAPCGRLRCPKRNMVDALRPHRLMRPSNLRGVMPGSQVMSPHGAKGHRCPWRGLRCSGGITGGVPCGDRELPRMVPLRHHYRFPECSLSTAMANGRPTAFNEGRWGHHNETPRLPTEAEDWCGGGRVGGTCMG